MFFGKPSFNTFEIISFATFLVTEKSASASKSAKEKPIEGTPSIAPSIAADMVPEYKTLVDEFSP